MVFDPLSLIGYVGTTAGLIGFLLSTVTRLEKFQRDYKDSAKQLRWYHTQMFTAFAQLKSWSRLWCSENYTQADQEYFWGPDGLQIVDGKIEGILIEMREIGKLLYGRMDQQTDEVGHISERNWRAWRDGLIYQRDFMPDLNALKKICFGSFRGGNLEERTKRLREKIADLGAFSQVQFLEAQCRAAASLAVDEPLLRELLHRRNWMEFHGALLTQLHEFATTRGVWSLVLSAPDAEGGPETLDRGNDLYIEFDAQAAESGTNQRDLGIINCYPSKLGSAGDAIAEWYERHKAVHPGRIVVVRGDYLASVLGTIPLRDPVMRIRLAKAAIGLVNWTMLLWNTPWTEGICSCRLRFVTVPLQDGTSGTLATFTAARDCQKLPAEHIERKALLMGISLAELALKQSIILSLSGESPSFTLGGQCISEMQLLARITAKNGRDYELAVKYCFDYDRRLSNGNEFRPRDIIVFKENVLDRLETYHAATVLASQRQAYATG